MFPASSLRKRRFEYHRAVTLPKTSRANYAISELYVVQVLLMNVCEMTVLKHVYH